MSKIFCKGCIHLKLDDSNLSNIQYVCTHESHTITKSNAFNDEWAGFCNIAIANPENDCANKKSKLGIIITRAICFLVGLGIGILAKLGVF